MSTLRIFAGSGVVTIASLIVAFLYGGPTALITVVILGILEISLSFDNAVVNAGVLKKMSRWWQGVFLTVGWFIAVVGMRFVLPVGVVCGVAGLSPVAAVELALQRGDPTVPGTYGYILGSAHPIIAGFGGAFLFLLFLNFILDGERDVLWLWPIEKRLAALGELDYAAVLLALGAVLVAAFGLSHEPLAVLTSGVAGIVTYIVVDGFGSFFEGKEDTSDSTGPSTAVKLTGRAAFFSFLYIEVLDGTFSFDGVIGAFAVSNDLILITLGLGFIGAMFVRSLTIYLVRAGTLDEYVHLETGAHWAIGVLGLLLLASVRFEIPEVVIGLSGVVIIGASFLSSLTHNRREAAISTGAHAAPTTPASTTPTAPARAENH